MFKKTTLAMLVGSLLIGCSGGGSGSSDAGNKTPPANDLVSISGVAVKGILAGAIVEAYDISSSTLLAETTTGTNGRYTLPAIDHNGPILVKLKTSSATKATCDSAIGCKDADGNPVAFGGAYSFNDSNFTLSALLPDADAATQQELMVTPVTHMGAERAIASGATTAADVDAVNRATAKLLGLNGIDINTVAPVDITDPSAMNSATAQQQLYATLVASIQTLAEQDPDSSIADVINTLADDYSTDGGLVGNSADEAKITLANIFSAAVKVVKAAEDKAADDGVILDLDNAETLLALAETEANEEEPDAEVVIPTDSVEPVATLETATAKGIALLEDLNLWQDALQADNQHLVQPFEDQLMGVQTVLTSLQEHSKVLQSSYTLVGENKIFQKCVYIDPQSNECGYFEESSEFVSGPLLDALASTADSVALAALIQGTLADNVTDSTDNTFNYIEQRDDINGLSLEGIDKIVYYNHEIVRTFTAVYSIKDSKISHIVFTMAGLPENELFQENSILTLTQADIDDAGVKIVFNILDSTLYAPEKGLALTIQGGEASVTFNSAAERLAFSDPTSQLDPSLAGVSAIDIQLNIQTIETLAFDSGDQITTSDLALNLDFDKAADNSTTTVVALALGTSNNQSENINGDLTLTVNGTFSETEVDSIGFTPALDLTNAAAQFNGDISIAVANANSMPQTASFTGQVNAAASFLSGNQNEEIIAETGSADFVGTITITTGDDNLTFDGNAEVFIEPVKTPEGIPFNLKDGTEYHANKAILFGKLTASQDSGSSIASLEINAAVTADIAGMDFVLPTSISEGDVASSLVYGISSNNPDHARYYINQGDALAGALDTLNNKGFDVTHNQNIYTPTLFNFNLDFNASNCTATDNGSFRICDITAAFAGTSHHGFESGISDADKIAFLNNHSASNDQRKPFTTPKTILQASAGTHTISENCSIYEGRDNCTVNLNFTATATLPVDITETNDRINYLKGNDSTASGNINEYSASCSIIDNQNLCDITEIRYNDFHVNPLLSDADKLILLKGQYSNINRLLTNTTCSLLVTGNSMCSFSYSAESLSVYINGGAAMDDDARLVAGLEIDYVFDTFNQQATGEIALINCELNSNDVSCDMTFEAIEVMLEIPQGIVEYYSEGNHSTYTANSYIKGVYDNDDSSFGLITCDGDMCEYSRTSVTSDQPFTGNLDEDSVSIIVKGANYYPDHNYELGDCNENICTVNFSMQEEIEFPASLTSPERTLYLDRISNGRAVDATTFTIDNCHINENGSEDCFFISNNNRTEIGVAINIQSGITQYAVDTLPSLSIGIPETFWANFHSLYGDFYLETQYLYPETILSGEVEELTKDIVVNRYKPSFEVVDFDTADAYIEISAALSVKAQLTGLDGAELIVFSDRLGLEDASATIKLINGTRAITLNIDSTKGFNDPEGFSLVINNDNAEMTITASCTTDAEDEGINDRALIDACEDGFNFKGNIFVDGFKVADLEDRNGLPVFRFQDGTGRDLVATPNLLFAPSAP